VGKEVAILQDLQGPKIRAGRLQGGKMTLSAGQEILIAPGADQTDPSVIPTVYDALPRDVVSGDRILLDDGLIRLTVLGVQGDRVRCRVEVGGVLKDRKGINLPGVAVSAPALTPKDIEDLEFGASLGVDLVSLSFVRRPEDVREARERLAALGSDAPIIAKIEKPEAVENLEAILEEADGIMVARGDLGVEIGPEKVPLLQKHAIELANRKGKLVITATQMLESMIQSAFPTRAEASDVANAVLDQTDAVMLSGETAVGAYPVLAVETMARIIAEVEQSARYFQASDALPPVDLRVTTNAVAHAAATAAKQLGARAIVCVSGHGGSPRLVSDYRPIMPIVALSHYREVLHRLAAWWGVLPVYFERSSDAEENIGRIDALLVERGIAAPGELVVITMVLPVESGEHTNTMKVHTVGQGAGGRGQGAG
jgi:pyruvate kinase